VASWFGSSSYTPGYFILWLIQMPQISKLKKEYQIEEDGTTVVPKEILPQIAPTVLKNTVKRERTEAQKANFEKVVQANKERWAKVRAEKEASTAQAKQAVKEDHQAKVEAGTHVRVEVKEKRSADPTARKHVAKPKGSQNESRPLGKEVVEEPEPESESEEEEVVIVKKPKEKVVKEKVKPVKKRVVYETETDTPTETETDDTDIEEYKQGKRQIRREVKKNIRAIEKIDHVVQQTMVNPYSALLASRWK
jgi:hypothetical protein